MKLSSLVKRGDSVDPTEKSNASRRRDGVVLIVQNNADKQLIIAETNEVAANLLGYAQGDLTNRNVMDILGVRTQSFLQEELEFHDDAPDFGDVIARQRIVRVKNRVGDEMALPCTVLRVVSQGHHPRFQLVLPDETEQRAREQLSQFLKTNLESRLERDAATDLPNRATTESYLELMKSYVAAGDMSVAFAIIRIDRFERSLARYGAADMAKMVKHVASFCRATFRSEDMISLLSPSTLGVLLFDISRESVRVVLNRLRGQIRSHHIAFGGKANFSVTISVAFDMLDADRGAGVLPRCEQAMANVDGDARNSLIELTDAR